MAHERGVKAARSARIPLRSINQREALDWRISAIIFTINVGNR